MKKVAVIQSNYIPWKGYFDLIHDVDEFIFYDDVQYTKNDWRNRNKIKVPNGSNWLTIPVGSDLDRLICEVSPSDTRWQEKHWKTLMQYYSRAPYFKNYRDFFEDFYRARNWTSLSELNSYLITNIAREFLGIPTLFCDSRKFVVHGKRLERLIDLLQLCGADSYISGPAAKEYIVPETFSRAGISLSFKDYSGYPVYPQFHPPFDHCVSILDLLFHVGPDAPWYIWGWRKS